MSQPISLLICALGGEGGGVLTEWLVEIARHAGYPAQATSIPGVAQRTGASAATIAQAFTVVRDAWKLRDLWVDIEGYNIGAGGHFARVAGYPIGFSTIWNERLGY